LAHSSCAVRATTSTAPSSRATIRPARDGAIGRSIRKRDSSAVAARAQLLGAHVRAALACGVPLSQPAQDRAAAIEAAALDYHQRQGGAEARDELLRSIAPPAFDPRQQGRDRATWCAARRADIQRVGRWLDSDEGAAFAAQAAAASAPPR
jgi:hypothetical protein